MNYTEAAKWALLYRGIATVSFLVGFGIVLLGLVVGLGGALTALASDPTGAGDALSQASPLVTLAFVAVGLVVWHLGKAFALFLTLPRASGEVAADAFDTARVRSEVLEALDDRLADMEGEIQETRRSVQELKREEHAAAFDEEEVSTSTPDASPDRAE